MAKLKARASFKRGEFLSEFMSAEKPIEKAATRAIRAAADQAKADARASIAASGMSTKWQNALRADVYPKSGDSINAVAHIYHKITRYAHVFEEGATIRGKPTLWAPLSNVPQKISRRKITPKTFPGPLQYVRRPGKHPLLMAKIRVSAAAARREQQGKISMAALKRGTSGSGVLISVPVFVGLSSVKIKKRFKVDAAVKSAAARLGELYFSNLRVD